MTEKKKSIFKRWWFWLIAVIIVFGIIGSQSESNPASVNSNSGQQTPTSSQSKQEPTDVQKEESVSVTPKPTVAPTPKPTVAPTPEPTIKETTGQRNAVRAAKNYLSFSAFSRKGLIEQLEFEGYSSEDAEYAVDQVGADWKEQAVKAAKNYLSFSSFSKSGLIEQLEFEGYTSTQAEYGADKAYE